MEYKFADKHGFEIKDGDTLFCSIDNSKETVCKCGDGLGIDIGKNKATGVDECIPLTEFICERHDNDKHKIVKMVDYNIWNNDDPKRERLVEVK